MAQPLNKQDWREIALVVSGGILLSFNSGFINGCTMSGLVAEGQPKQGVAGFTGTYTNTGMFLAEGAWRNMGFNMAMFSSFILGACITGMINPKATPYQLSPSYGPTFLLGSLVMVGASLAAEYDPHGRWYYYLAAMANGIQNAMTSIYSANLIRTCHLTGTSTDIGLIIGQMIRGHCHQTWKLLVLLSLAISFLFGGTISYWAMREYTNHALFFSAGLYFLIAAYCVAVVACRQKISLWAAATGSWTWRTALAALQSLGEPEDKGVRTSALLLDVFDEIDADSSDTIDAKELEASLQRVGFDIEKNSVSNLMAYADTNGDDLISRAEWSALIDASTVRLFIPKATQPAAQYPVDEGRHDTKGGVGATSVILSE